MTITTVFDPPLPTDNPATFNSKAFVLVGDLNDWSTEANATAAAVNADATTATTQAGIAATGANTATTQAGIATTQAGIATTQASNALASANSAAASYDAFDDRYLGSKSSDPTLDNDGNALLTGALYWNSVSNEMRVWTGAAWAATYLPAANYVAKTGDTMTDNLTVPSLNTGQLAGLRNLIINGSFAVNQRAPATNADDTYAHDRWYALTQTGTIAVTTLSDVENTTPTMARLTQSQASAQRMGYAQIIEGKNCKHLRGQQVTFRFGRTRLSSSANVRFAVLEWTGTEDAVTSDVVLDWTSSTYTAGNFFLASNITVSGVVQQALTAATLTDGSSVTVTLGSSFNNLIVFAWTESTVAQNVTFDLGKAQIEVGAVATPLEIRPLGMELALCQRYYYRASATADLQSYCLGFVNATTNAVGLFPFPVVMRTPPTALEQNGTAAHYKISAGGVVYICNAVPTFNAATTLNATSLFYSTGMTVSNPATLAAGSATSYLGWSAEL